MNLDDEFSLLQKEIDEINEVFGIKSLEALERVAQKSIEQYLGQNTELSKKTLEATVNFTLLFLELGKNNIEDFITILYNKDDIFKTLKGTLDAYSEILALDVSLEKNKLLYQKKHTINVCLKLFQDLTEYMSGHLSYIMKIINIDDKIFNKKDYNSSLFEKIDKLEGINDQLDYLLGLINRKLRNKVGHADIFYDFEECVFRDKNKKFICNYEEFQKLIYNAFAFDQGLILSYSFLELIFIGNNEMVENYFIEIEKQCLFCD